MWESGIHGPLWVYRSPRCGCGTSPGGQPALLLCSCWSFILRFHPLSFTSNSYYFCIHHAHPQMLTCWPSFPLFTQQRAAWATSCLLQLMAACIYTGPMLLTSGWCSTFFGLYISLPSCLPCPLEFRRLGLSNMSWIICCWRVGTADVAHC